MAEKKEEKKAESVRVQLTGEEVRGLVSGFPQVMCADNFFEDGDYRSTKKCNCHIGTKY